MADPNTPTGTTVNFDEIQGVLEDLANEIGPNIPDSNAALRAIGDAFRTAHLHPRRINVYGHHTVVLSQQNGVGQAHIAQPGDGEFGFHVHISL